MESESKAKAAGAPVKVNLSKPVFVLRRTKEMLNELPAQDSRLRDPNSENSEQPAYATNGYRSRTEDVLVLVGLCTHVSQLSAQCFEQAGCWFGAISLALAQQGTAM